MATTTRTARGVCAICGPFTLTGNGKIRAHGSTDCEHGRPAWI